VVSVLSGAVVVVVVVVGAGSSAESGNSPEPLSDGWLVES
jgi:hypothetical protein